MRVGFWGAAGIVVILGSVGLVFVVDHTFKSAVSEPELPVRDGGRAITIADNGFLSARRALFLICLPGGRARAVAKARLAERGFLKPGAKAAGEIRVAAWDRRARPDVTVKVAMTITSVDWVDTLESEVLPREAVSRIAERLRKPDADFVAVHAMERAVYFSRAGDAPTPALADCLSR